MKLFEINDKNNIPLTENSDADHQYAIIGMDCSIGRDDSIYEFWQSLCAETDFIEEAGWERRALTQKIMDVLTDGDTSSPLDMPSMCYMRDIDKFDYQFFGMSLKEAVLLDPAHRLLLQSTYRCLEDTNQPVSSYQGKNIGVFLGYDDNDLIQYKDILYKSNPGMFGMSIPHNHSAIMAGRLSYHFDFKGPAYTINTACSSSMSALHLACRSLQVGDCDMALVGTVNFTLTPLKQNNFKMGIVSSSERSKTFSHQADGIGKGEGLVSLFIKPYHQAVADGDSIYAVIAGTAANQDGCSSSLTSPNMLAQADVLQKAWRAADINPRNIRYIEAHGTGTKIGDPIEMEAVSMAMKPYTCDRMFCATGSVKSNIGHLNAAAGLAGILKTAMMLYHHTLIPSCHFDFPNPHIDFLNSPVYVCTQTRKLTEKSNYAAVSSFGLSGTNVHAVLSDHQAGDTDAFESLPFYRVLAVSAATPSALRALAEAYLWFTDSITERQLDSFCYTANTRRIHHTCRCIFLFEDMRQLRQEMSEYLYADKQPLFSETGGIPAPDHRINGILVRNTQDDIMLLNMLCRRYLEGEDIVWDQCYAPHQLNTIHIPTYRFDKLPCFWESDGMQPTRKQEEKNMYFYTASWVEENLSDLPEKQFMDTVVIFYSHTRLSGQVFQYMQKWFQEKGYQIVGICLDEENTHTDSGKSLPFQSDFWSGKKVTVIYLVSLTDLKEDVSRNGASFQDMFTIRRIIKACRSGKANITDFICVGSYGDDVLGGEQVCAYTGALYEFIHGLAAECISGLSGFYNVDITSDINWTLLMQTVSRKVSSLCAIRNGKVYNRTFVEMKLPAQGYEKINPVIIVSGGLSLNTLQVCYALCRKNKGIFYLLSRNTEKHLNNYEIKKIIQNITDLGGTVCPVCCDVSSEEAVQATVGQIAEETGGVVDGIIHAAGCEAKGLTLNKNEQDIYAVIAPKAAGLLYLHRYTRQYHPDFFICFSSLAAYIASPGQAEYAYANRFMDLYIQNMKQDYTYAASINWPAFQDAGMAVRNHVDFTEMVIPPLRFNEISEVFMRVLTAGVRQIIPSAHQITGMDNVTDAASCLNQVSDEREMIFPDMTILENQIAKIWIQFLGHQQFTLDDQFLTVGGNSINTIYVAAEIEKLFRVELGDDFITQFPSIRDTANRLIKELHKNTVILQEIEPFNYFFFINCFYNTLFSVLTYYHYPVSLFLQYFKSEVRCEKQPYTIEYRLAHNMEEIIKSMGWEIERSETAHDLISPVVENLNKGRPSIVSIDCFDFPVRRDMYQKTHHPHSILIYGYDAESLKFYILDQINAESLSYQKQIVDARDLVKAHEGYCRYYQEEKIPACICIYPLAGDMKQKGITDQPVHTDLNERRVHTEEIHQSAQDHISQDTTPAEEKIKTLSHFIHYINIEIYMNQELFEDEEYYLLLNDYLSQYKKVRSRFIKNTLYEADK